MKFPEKIFNNEVKDYIDELYMYQGLNKDYLYCSYIATMSITIGKRLNLYHHGYTTYASLWIAIVGYSGMKKTPSINSMLDPVINRDKEMYNEYINTKDEFEESNKPYDKLIVDDTTIEALLETLFYNKQLLFKKDELIGLLKESTRYNSGGIIERLLSIYSNDDVTINRKQGDKNRMITSPYLSIIGGIQDDLLKELSKGNNKENGFLNRFLFCFPDEMKRKQPFGKLDENKRRLYQNKINESLNILSNLEICNKISMSKDADSLYNQWLRKYNYNDQVDFNITGYKSKLEDIVRKLSLIIACSNDLRKVLNNKQIDSESMKKAIDLSYYFVHTFKKAQSKMFGNDKRKFSIETIKNKLLINKKLMPEVVKEIINSDLNFSQRELANELGISIGTVNKYIKRSRSTL
tara:strand:- start:1651 stop:2874 length:1224 start_codon:yes stop_codon:yes gene_type:complete